MPGLLLLAIVGTVFLVRRRGLLARAVAPAAIGLTAGTVFVITIAFVTNRYLADFVPPLVLLALVGVQAVASMRPVAARSGRTGIAAIVVLCAFGAWASFGLAVVYQRNLQPNDPGYGRGTGTPAAAPARSPERSPARRDLNVSAPHPAPTAARITIDGSAVARKRV
jgi:hypothetical protein